MPGCLADGCGWLPEGKVLSLTHDLRGATHFLLQGPKIWLVVRAGATSQGVPESLEQVERRRQPYPLKGSLA